jgi:hypothetical protein
MPRLLCCQEASLLLMEYDNGWVLGLVWTFWRTENSLAAIQIRTQGHAVHTLDATVAHVLIVWLD